MNKSAKLIRLRARQGLVVWLVVALLVASLPAPALGAGSPPRPLRAVQAVQANQDYNSSYGPVYALPGWGNVPWADPKYYTTIQLGDLDGDGKDELIGREAQGIKVHKFNANPDTNPDTNRGQWVPVVGPAQTGELLLPLADTAEWSLASSYATIQLADVDGNPGQELVARSASGIVGYQFKSIAAKIVPPRSAEAVGASGSFTAHPTTPSFGAGLSFDVALGDLDRDGDLDAVVANGKAEAEAETVWVNAGTGGNSLLDPNSFTSHGPSPFGTAGTYTINASRDNPAPTLSGPGITTPIAGVFYDPTPSDAANRDEIAVFTFDSITIPAGVSVSGERNQNSRPVALLSQGSITIAGSVDVSGAGGANNSGFRTNAGGSGGAAGPGGGGGGGGGAGEGDSSVSFPIPLGTPGTGGAGYVAGGNGGTAVFNTDGPGGAGGSVVARGGGTGGDANRSGGGGAFGGNGGTAYLGTPGGTAYGDLALLLQGGSGGGAGGGGGLSGAGGGGGGGAIELGAATSITISGSLLSNGGAGGSDFRNGGGGAGGGILIHGHDVTLGCSASISAAGGSAANRGGGGGGGRVHIAATDTITTAGDLNSQVNVAGGGGQPGGAGVLTTAGTADTLDPLSMTTTSLPDGRVGVSYDRPLDVSGGSSPYTFTVTGGTLPDGLTLTSSSGQLSGTPTAGGTFSFTITVHDDFGCPASQSYTVVINANAPPAITAATISRQQGATGTASTIATVSDDLTPVGSLTVTVSSAPAGISLTNITNTGGTISATVAASCTATLGNNLVGLRVTDGGGLTATANLTVNVTRSNPPTITLGPAIKLWPPTHLYRTVGVTDLVQGVSDDCTALSVSDVKIARVTSDEPEDAAGDSDGETLKDIRIAPDCSSVQLRAERDGLRNGRVYTIWLLVRDSSGNATEVSARVTVQLSQGGAPAADSGVAYTVTSSCP